MLTFHFWAAFGGKMGVATTHAPNSMGPPNPSKKSVHWVDLLDQPLSLNPVFEIFRPEPPPLIVKISNFENVHSAIKRDF